MATELQSQNQSIAIKSSLVETVAKIVWHINQVVAYPLTDRQIEDWAKSILELKPDIDLGALKFLIDKFKTAEAPYDYHCGIQNIFVGLRHVQKTEKGFIFSKDPVPVFIPRKEGTDNQEQLDELDRRLATGDYVKFPKINR